MGPRFSTALAFANEEHAGQFRKGTRISYIAHLLAVTALVIEAGGDEDTAIAALLHDVVEDQGGRPMLAQVQKRFGPVVAGIVEENSDAVVIPKPQWWPRKLKYLKALPHKSRRARLVSLADKVHNAEAILSDYRQLGEQVWKRFKGHRKGTLKYYRALVEVFRNRVPDRVLFERLENAVVELEALTAGKE